MPSPMIHHLSLAVTNLNRSAAFYDPALGALGYQRCFTRPNVIGYGFIDNSDIFSIRLLPEEKIMSGPGFHLAFIGRSRAAIDNFHKAALANGGKDNGGSGLSPEYGADYYAAFVFDPDGYRIEAVISPHTHS
jgi:catechol 2,3-dioxygenase-like lactoylglutathione lyase family enzyme